MSSIADAKAAIYSRLASAPTFHPSSVDLFEDWTLQGGDVVTVKSDDTSYNMPIYGMQMKWNGKPKVTAQSTGNEKRDSIEKMAQKQADPSGGGTVRGRVNSYRSNKKRQERLEWIVGIDENGEYFIDHPGSITLAINDAQESIASIRADHVNISAYNTFHSLAGSLEYASDGKLIIHDAGGVVVERTEQGISAKFGVYDEGTLTGGIIVSKVNGRTSTLIDGNKIRIGTQDTDTVSITDAFEIVTVDQTQRVKIKKPLYSGSDLYLDGNLYQSLLSNNYIQTKMVKIVGGGSQPSTYELKEYNVRDMIIKAQVINNTLRLWKMGSDTSATSGTGIVDFSKATTLSGAWSSGVFTVNASPQGETFTTTLVQGTPSWSGTTVTIPINAYDSDNPSYTYWTGRDVSATYSGGSISSDDIQIGSYNNVSSKPSGTDAPNMKDTILAAINNRNWFRFKVTVNGTSAEKYYRMDFGS